jgi:hypothetical protein
MLPEYIPARMATMNDLFRNIVNNTVRDNVNYARDRATWDAASTVERATFGKIFNFLEGILGLIAVLGCFFIASAMQDQRLLLYVCGVLWLVPFIAAGVLLARFRHTLFVRVRGLMNNFLGGGR